MDIPSHALWAYGIWRWRKQSKRDALFAALFAVIPDFIAFGYDTWLQLFSHQGPLRYDSLHGHLHYAYSPITFILYQYTHSLIFFGLLFGGVLLVRHGKPWWPLLGWGLHILEDIFTHRSLAHFQTPFFFPFQSPSLGLVDWSTPWFLLSNYFGLALFYLWLARTKRL